MRTRHFSSIGALALVIGSFAPAPALASLHTDAQALAVKWLLEHQNPSGTWGADARSEALTTAAVVRALHGVGVKGPQLRRAESWLATSLPPVTRDLAYGAMALAGSADPILLDAQVMELKDRHHISETRVTPEILVGDPDFTYGNRIILHHESLTILWEEPGWGFAGGHFANPWDTSVVLRALELSKLRAYEAWLDFDCEPNCLPPDLFYLSWILGEYEYVQFAYNQVLEALPVDLTEGWPYNPNVFPQLLEDWELGLGRLPTEIIPTAAAQIAMGHWAILNPDPVRADEVRDYWIPEVIASMRDRIQSDFGFGDELPSTVEDTAMIYTGLVEGSRLAGDDTLALDPDLVAAMDQFLLPAQITDSYDADRGSWGGDAFDTALALTAIVVSRMAEDADGDGYSNSEDTDIDGDGYDNVVDAVPFDASEFRDTDGDGVGNNADLDRDGDGYCNDPGPDVPNVCVAWDRYPDDPNAHADLDTDTIADAYDDDIDGDGVANELDALPFDASDWQDTDRDGVGNVADLDDDGDGIVDASDPCPAEVDASCWDVRVLATTASKPAINDDRVTYTLHATFDFVTSFDLATETTLYLGYADQTEAPTVQMSDGEIAWVGPTVFPDPGDSDELWRFDGTTSATHPVIEDWSLSARDFAWRDPALGVVHANLAAAEPPTVLDADLGASGAQLARGTAVWWRGAQLMREFLDDPVSEVELAAQLSPVSFTLDRVSGELIVVCDAPWGGAMSCYHDWLRSATPYPSNYSFAGGVIHEVDLASYVIGWVKSDGADREIHTVDTEAGQWYDLTDNDFDDHTVRVSKTRAVWIQDRGECTAAQAALGCDDPPSQVMAADLANGQVYQVTNYPRGGWELAGTLSLSGQRAVWDVSRVQAGFPISEVHFARLGGDVDADSVPDQLDNCLEVANASQCDVDLDGYGNHCDADYNQDWSVGIPDFALFRTANLSGLGDPEYDPNIDMDCNNSIGISDFQLFKNGNAQLVGPSGLSCAGTLDCVADPINR